MQQLKHLLLSSLFITIIVNFAGKTTAVQLDEQKFAFESAILLSDTYATFNGVRVRAAKYYFDIELPNDIGEPLGKIVIKQRTGGDEIKFKPEKTKAYLGNHRQKQSEIELNTVYDQDTGTVTITFPQPVSPGNNLTISLKPKRNPKYAGVYLFGVTAFPPGKESSGLYLGAGRFHFYKSDSFYL